MEPKWLKTLTDDVAQHPWHVLAPLILLSYFITVQTKVYLVRRRIRREHGCKPPQGIYRVYDPILGIDHILRLTMAARESRLLDGAVARYKRCGNTHVAQVRSRRMIWTIEPENIKTILATSFKDFTQDYRAQFLVHFLGWGTFTTDGEAWAHSRAMLRPNFVRDQIADLDSFESHVQDLFQLIPRDGSTVDLQDLFFRLTIDSATEFLFGHSVRSLRPTNDATSLEARFPDAFMAGQRDCIVRFRLGPLQWLKRDRESKEAIRVVHEYIDQFVDKAVAFRECSDLEKKGDGKYVFLHELAKATGDKQRLRAELLNILLAGRDTTASLLSQMFLEIAKQPRIWDKLQEEIASLNGRRPSYEELRNFKYLKYCINESLRLHPVVPSNFRKAVRDTVLPLGGGPDGKSPLFVKKDTVCHYQIYAMHRREDFYGPDAETFRPERWEHLRPSWSYLPFNGGPRICLGQQYALTEASYVTVRILQEFKSMESRDSEPWKEYLTLTMCSKNGTQVSLTPR